MEHRRWRCCGSGCRWNYRCPQWGRRFGGYWDWRCDGGNIRGNFVAVATIGTTAATVGGMVIATAGGGIASAAGEYTRQVVNHEEINKGAIWREALIGGACGLLGFGIGKALGLSKPIYKRNGKLDILRTMAEGAKTQTHTDRILSLPFSATVVGPAQLTASKIGGWVAEPW